MKKIKIAVVSPYPPSDVTLSEYGYHLVKHLAKKDEIEEIIVLTNHLNAGHYPSVRGNVRLVPCWSFNGLKNIFSITQTIKNEQPDVVLFNLQFMLFGDNKVAAALGLMIPFLLKMMRIPTVTLLHNILEEVDLSSAGFADNKLLKSIYNFIGTCLTRLILKSSVVGVTIEKYVDTLRSKYNADNVVLIPHGSFEIPPLPDFDKKHEKIKVMTFGKFGTYKKVEILIEAVQQIRTKTQLPIELVIAGTDNPNVKGYLEGVKEKYTAIKDVTFTGYVAEEDVPVIFSESTVVVFPYTSTTGSSGVLHQAGSYGKAVVLPKLGDLERLIDSEGYAGAYFEPESVDGLAQAIENVITDKVYRKKLEYKNYQAAAGLSMSEIADWYLLHFGRVIAA
jgi:glycosyltransferase involved in cell wall biosynthesis